MSTCYNFKPAFYADLLFSFSLYFNQHDPECIERFVNPKKRSADIKYFRDCIARFGTPAEELCPVFVVYKDKSFAFHKLFDFLATEEDYSLDCMQRYLTNGQVLAEEVCKFFLPEQTQAGIPDIAKLTDLIRDLQVDTRVKYHLLAMMVNPDKYYRMLLSSLQQRAPKLEEYYKERAELLQAVQVETDEAFIHKFLEQSGAVKNKKAWNDAEYGIALLSKNAIRIYEKKHLQLILGFDYIAHMKVLIGESVKPDIIKMGKALSEEKRVTILQMLLVEKEVTAQQLLQKLELSMTATHYHLEMLLSAGMLLTRNEGRTIFYSLNRAYFDRAPIVFEEYSHANA